ncbi:MAG: NADPH-dependent stearoyl-CoA 9-desaturase [Acidobacteria bacterium]|nr:NADPH-dependent stearoyl-CoA 9-desaturase [Acidobacteriota bacterium]
MQSTKTMTSAALLSALRREVAARGWNRKATGRIIGELFLHIFLSLAGAAVFVLSGNPFTRVCGLALVVVGSMGVGTNTHTASHYAASDRRWVNDFLTYFGYPFFLGLSATFWRHQHVTVHHPAPNVVEVDDDCDLWPWFAMTEEEVRRSGGWRRWYYEKLQWIFFPLALAANGFNFVKTGWLHLFRMLRDPGKRRRAHWIDLAALALHHVVYLAVPMLFFTPGAVMTFYLLRTTLMGYGMFALQAPGHFPAENARLAADQRNADYLLLQTATTTNFRAGFIGRLFTSGLDYQIEHHLFPNVSHVHYRKMAGLVESFCRENGLPYRVYRWDHILWKCWMVFRSPRPIVGDAETLRISSENHAGERMARSASQ